MTENSGGYIVTRAGLNVLAKAIAGKQLLFTRVSLGDCERNGQEVEVTDDEAYELNALIHKKKDLPITGEPTVSGGIAYIKFTVQNAEVSEGFWLCETGIFARDPDTNAEVLYAYEYKGKRGGWLPPSGGSEIWQEDHVAAIAVAQAENITAIIDQGLLFVTQAEFQNHVNATKPHPNTPSIGQAVTETNYVWATGSDNNLHPMTLDNFTRQALGGDAAEIPLINSRISQTEVNIANLYTQLNAEQDLGDVKPNLLITDDFENPTNTDFYRQPVITSAAGISNVRVASDYGLHIGSWYTLSDGAKSEFVQVIAVAKNGDANVAVLADNVVNTYDLNEAKLYRTTTTIENGTGVGAGDLRSAVYPFTLVWQGTTTEEDSVLTLNTTYANAAAFTLSGDWAFTSDGAFTLTET